MILSELQKITSTLSSLNTNMSLRVKGEEAGRLRGLSTSPSTDKYVLSASHNIMVHPSHRVAEKGTVCTFIIKYKKSVERHGKKQHNNEN